MGDYGLGKNQPSHYAFYKAHQVPFSRCSVIREVLKRPAGYSVEHMEVSHTNQISIKAPHGAPFPIKNISNEQLNRHQTCAYLGNNLHHCGNRFRSIKVIRQAGWQPLGKPWLTQVIQHSGRQPYNGHRTPDDVTLPIPKGGG